MKTNDKPTSVQGEAEGDRAGRSVKKASRKSAFWSGALALGAVGVSAQSVKAQDAGDLASIESARVLPDGSLSVVLSDGRSLSLSPDEYEIVDGAVVIDPPVAEALGLAGSGSGLSLPLLGGVAAGVAALAGGAAALAGGGDSDGSGAGGSANQPPVFTSGATASVAENTPVETAVYTPIVTDADGGPLEFTLSGTDAELFDIDPETGVVTFKTAPDFENPGDLAGDGSVAGDNVYDIVITASDGTHSTDQAVTITVTDVNEPPVFTSGATASVAENTPVETAVYTPTVTDADGDTLTFTLSGTDAALFDIDANTGVVTFKTAPDYEAPGDLAGDGSVAGDNVYDIVITASDGTNSTTQAVTITVTDVHEPASVLDLSNISITEGIIIRGDGAGDQAGFSVSSAGDVNGDGFEDLIVGAPRGDDGGNDAGEAYVIYGGTGLANIDLSTLTADQGFIIQGDGAGDNAGFSVSSAGDVNGDGFDDLIVGARYGDDGGTNAGEAYVIYGGTGLNGAGLANIDLANLTVAQGFIIQGDAAGDRAGWSVSSAGDVNGDGFDDLIVGAPFGDDVGISSGEAYVLYGGTGLNGAGLANIDLSDLSSDQGFIIRGDAQNDWAGFSVSSAGDLNGDGFDDLIVGAFNGSDGGSSAGEAYVLYGGTGLNGAGLANIDLSTLTADQGFIIQGDRAGDHAGHSVSSAGDVNGDGFDDLIVGARFGDDGGIHAGEAYVIYGGTELENIDLSDLSSDQGFIIQGAAADDRAGFSVSSAGDVNGDGFDDLIVGAPYGDDAGKAYVIYGGTELGNIDLSDLTNDQGFIIQGDEVGDRAGRSVSSAGDVNGDGFDDLIVGAPNGDDGGEAYVIYGGATGTESTLAVTRAGTDGVADNFTGNAGNDTFTGIGANDVVRGGAGDDSITLTDLNFAKVDGGHGYDTLLLGGSGMTLDLTGARTDVESFETIDLTGTGDNTLVIDALSLFDLSGDTANGITTFKVTGDTGDQVTLTDTGWSADGQQDEDGVTFDVYANGQAEIWIEEAVTVSM